MLKKTQTRLALQGASGRMGREILKLARQEKMPLLRIGRGDWEHLKSSQLDVVIDFSSPAGFSEALSWCLRHRKPLVSGTTGLSRRQKNDLARAGRKIPILWAANMSLGVQVLLRALRALTAVSDWQFRVSETHHRLKRDRPSGTALVLEEALEEMVGRRRLRAIQSRRVGQVIGVHSVTARSPEEELSFRHEALNRAVFARGALTAASWLRKRKGKAGLYTMSDVLSDLEES